MSVDVYCVGERDFDYDAEERTFVNMSNVNAADVVAALGLDWDEVRQGTTLEGWDLLGRCLVALAVAPADEGFDTYELTRDEVRANPLLDALCGGERGPRVFRGGRSAGYLQERLQEVQRIAEVAVTRGVRVFIG